MAKSKVLVFGLDQNPQSFWLSLRLCGFSER